MRDAAVAAAEHLINRVPDVHAIYLEAIVREVLNGIKEHAPQPAPVPEWAKKAAEGITPLPWIKSRSFYTPTHPERFWGTNIAASRGITATAYGATRDESEANAGLISESCNAHPAMLSALGVAERALQAIRERTFVVTDSAIAEYHKLSEIRQNTDAALPTIRALLPASD
jgi:hypothetical protein